MIGIASSVMQAIKKPYFALIIGVLRQLTPIFVFFLLGEVFQLGISGIWWGIVLVNYLATFLAWYVVYRLLNRLSPIKMSIFKS
jgi:Na+-driven multidrug efflux pump